MSEAIRLMVQEPVMVKRGTTQKGKPWELWKFKAICPDGNLHAIKTFWSVIDQYNGKEIVGTVSSEERTNEQTGESYTSRTFVPDADWDTARKAAGDTPIQAPQHKPAPAPGLKTGTQVLKEQQAKMFEPPDEKREVMLRAWDQAGRGANTLTMAGVIKDAESWNLVFDTIFNDLMSAWYGAKNAPVNPHVFAPNTTAQVKSDHPYTSRTTEGGVVEREPGEDGPDFGGPPDDSPI